MDVLKINDDDDDINFKGNHAEYKFVYLLSHLKFILNPLEDLNFV